MNQIAKSSCLQSQRDAHHECGHAVIAVLLGVDIHSAELAFDPNAPATRRQQDQRIIQQAIRGRLDLLFPAARAEYLRACELEAVRLVAEHQSTIAALASELLSKQKMNGAEIGAFVRQRISGRPDSEPITAYQKKNT
jgi:hypothetical protein